MQQRLDGNFRATKFRFVHRAISALPNAVPCLDVRVRHLPQVLVARGGLEPRHKWRFLLLHLFKLEVEAHAPAGLGEIDRLQGRCRAPLHLSKGGYLAAKADVGGRGAHNGVHLQLEEVEALLAAPRLVAVDRGLQLARALKFGDGAALVHERKLHMRRVRHHQVLQRPLEPRQRGRLQHLELLCAFTARHLQGRCKLDVDGDELGGRAVAEDVEEGGEVNGLRVQQVQSVGRQGDGQLHDVVRLEAVVVAQERVEPGGREKALAIRIGVGKAPAGERDAAADKGRVVVGHDPVDLVGLCPAVHEPVELQKIHLLLVAPHGSQLGLERRQYLLPVTQHIDRQVFRRGIVKRISRDVMAQRGFVVCVVLAAIWKLQLDYGVCRHNEA
mmetsp:Transcript_47380/g.119344  ORF Transcript_47380/g.119344 Transcript_47380/m.119344 type:complete len:386 (+) Transcript_47380:969-2126(+)